MSTVDKPHRPEIPQPPHPEHRREPLPESQPKAGEEDPGAPTRIQALLDSPSYRRADQDVNFLERDEARGLRLNLEYMKPDLLLKEHAVRNTIVVFGSTRFSEPAAARRRVQTLEADLREDPQDIVLQRRLGVARRVSSGSWWPSPARARWIATW
jgi:hypothetical protein